VILQGINGASIRAKETDPTGSRDWNLAGAGRYQCGEGMVRVKRLKMVTVEFASVEGTFLLSWFLLWCGVVSGCS
jgi:hypothetical protein